MPASAATIQELRNRIQQIEGDKLTPSSASECEPYEGQIRFRKVNPCNRNCAKGRRGLTAASLASDEAKLGSNASQHTEEQAFRKIERLVCMREHASKALQARLVKDGFSEEIAKSAVERAQRCGLVSNERFADVLVRSRISQGKGLQGIAAELTALDINPYTVPEYVEAAEHVNGPDELARALALLDAKPPRGKHLRESAYRKLMQKGYGASVASSAARIWTEEHVATFA